jgi:DMSO/TMAO reductase YedYZ molybdopterin-dependent catalytic subunit
MTRREYLGLLALDFAICCKPQQSKKYIFRGVVPFSREGHMPMDSIVGSELDGRLFTDLSTTDAALRHVPTSRFYIRTCASRLLPPTVQWKCRIRIGRRFTILTTEDLARKARPMGAYLLECAGNARGAHFGMIGVAQWAGIPVANILHRVDVNRYLLFSGFDNYQERSLSSTAGASWIFREGDLLRADAFLATGMNGAPLTADHGAPLRLIVPGWYGCCCIKWLNEISTVSDRTRPTSQMIEYAERTHQDGVPTLASDYEAAVIDFAAMPVRVEKWSENGRFWYHIFGIAWGGETHELPPLQIRFTHSEEYVPVSEITSVHAGIKAHWSHWWLPRKRGVYEIQLRTTQPGIRTRRLSAGYYNRLVEISDL